MSDETLTCSRCGYTRPRSLIPWGSEGRPWNNSEAFATETVCYLCFHVGELKAKLDELLKEPK